LSTSLSASVAIPGIPKFYKSNVQGANKSISTIPNFLNGLYLQENERSGLSEVDITLLGVKREEGKSILLENVFIYGADTNLWQAKTTFNPVDYNYDGWCSILNIYRTSGLFGNANRSDSNPRGWLIRNRRVQGNQILTGFDAYYDPTTQQSLPGSGGAQTVPITELTTFTQPYVYPIIYHNSRGSCVTLEGWLDPYITPWWSVTPGDFCSGYVRQTNFGATLSLDTSRAYRYEPGKATTFTMGIKVDLTGGVGVFNGDIVNSRAMWGARNDTDTYRFVLEGDGTFYVERVSPYAETCLRVNRKDFIDPLDGTGPSGITIDFSKVTMYSIEFSWYGAVGANFYIYIPIKNGECKWVKVASLLSSNRYTKPALSNPNMRLFTELYIPMGCTSLQTMSLYGSSVYIDGNYRDTIKYYTASTVGQQLDQRSRTYITLEIPNFLEGNVFRPKNNANDYPKTLNGISTADAQIELYESTSAGGALDICTAYYESKITPNVNNNFLLLKDIINGYNTGNPPIATEQARIISLSAIGMTEEQKIDFMRRITKGWFTMSVPTTAYHNYTYAGTERLSGTFHSYDVVVNSVSSRVNDPRINIILSNGIYPNFFVYQNTAAQPFANTYPIVSKYPAIPGGAVIWSPSQQPPGTAICKINPDVPVNRAFVVNRNPVLRGLISIDTDLLQMPAAGESSFYSEFGIIAESAYQRIRNNNFFFDEINVNSSTKVQQVTTSPMTEFENTSELYWKHFRGAGSEGTSGVVGDTFPFVAGTPWTNSVSPPVYNFNNLPTRRGSYLDRNAYGLNSLILDKAQKIRLDTRIEPNNFTLNIDIREHNFIINGFGAQVINGPDDNYTYIRAYFKSSNLFSIEDGIPTNNLYNFKLLIYGHNGTMMNCMANRAITSPSKNWSEPAAILLPFGFSYGTTYTMSDAALETDGALSFTVGFPKRSTTAINAFIKNPNIQYKFKSTFLRNTQYYSPTDNWYPYRNAGLWYGTFFLGTLEPVHVYVILGSKTTFNNNWPQQMLESISPISRPMVTNWQYSTARDRNNVLFGETPQLETQNTTLVTTITSTTNGVLKGLPTTNFNFQSIPGINTTVDSSTCQVLNGIRSSSRGTLKDRRFTFTVNKNIPFTYDLSAVYNPARFILNPLAAGILNKDFKRFYVTAKTTKNESLVSTPWWFSQYYGRTVVSLFTVANPVTNDLDATLFTIDTTDSGSTSKNTYIYNTLKSVQPSDNYYIWSIYAKPFTPALSAGRYIIFEQKTGESNSAQAWKIIYFDIIDNKIGFVNGGSTSINGSTTNYLNRYDKNVRGTVPITPAIQSNTNWFSAAKTSFPKISGFANLDNKGNGRYTVAAHIEDAGNGWKRISVCTYYKNNHMDNVIYIGAYSNSLNVYGNVSLWGFKEELISNDTTIDTASAWFPSPYTPIGGGIVSLNLTTGEQL